ncbi:RNA 2'-phosphotransferase [Nocardioides sp. YIM 152315]|uniref:RNA 2'-phosphotransferase n=1 Tax=Nocardioides sp. YIM 152315 TaxID=3031760 RepID=UPI0023DC0B6A|nr:RNA 2'-phosphotransferase [Nocardioides sp. YIM 152315]MDF1605355.1 RNA 2'-phosphotransferase [Nocardioides sp. YIM 152315]
MPIMKVISPGALAKALERNPRVPLPAETRSRLQETLNILALRPEAAAAEDAAVDEHGVRFECLLEDAPRAIDIVAAWSQVLHEDLHPTVAEALLLESYFSSGAPVVAPLLPAGMRYFKTLQVIRERTAIALHDYAREINWRRPVLFVQVLKVARGYLRDVVGRPELTRDEFRREFTGRLGVTSTLIGRFESIDRQDAEEAVEALRLSLRQGNSPDTAVPYLLEAATLVFDAGGDVTNLQSCLEYGRKCLDSRRFNLNATALLATSDIYLRLASVASGQARRSALSSAMQSVDTAVQRAGRGDTKIAARLMATLIRELAQDLGLLDEHRIAGLRLPFCIRTPSETPALVTRFSADLVRSIAGQARTGDPLARGVCADLLELTDASGTDPDALRQIVEFRSAARRRAPLDERSQLLSLRDQLQLASRAADTRRRGEVIKELILMSIAAPTSASPILLIAQDTEANGPVSLSSKTSARGSEVARAAVAGDSRELLRMAANRAATSPDLSVAPMGGRSDVTTVGDYYGLVAQTFIFKEVQAIAVEREQTRAAALRAAISDAGRTDDYLVCEYLDAVPLNTGMVRSVRRFVPGQSVSMAVDASSHDERVSLLARTAAFLGFMNSVETATPKAVRKDLKAKEVGRWIRSLGVSEATTHFDEWWNLVSHVGVTRRRDAHLDNWVLALDGRLLALDLEATGCRPVGYELAQITDDHGVLEPNDWAARRVVFKSYCEARRETGAPEGEWSAYQASLAARAVGKLTWSSATPDEQEHARAMLESIAEHGSEDGVRTWARNSLNAWRRRRGLANLSSGELNMDRHRRRRVSKAMAFHLRHGDRVNLDPDGWASLGELVAAIGSGVTETEIAIVASTLSEPRFEFRDNLVRARYGHTRNVPGLMRDASKPSELRAYHATDLESAHHIVELVEGLRPMGRQFVHLSTDRREALRAGLRRGSPVLLSIAASAVPGALIAAGNTLVAPAVASGLVRVEPVAAYWRLVPRAELP